jgi:uncharacterized protein YcbX
MPQGNDRVRLSALHRYPLKSGRAQILQTATVGAIGIDGDRNWMLIDANGEMITGREFPKLVLVEAVADADGATFTAPGQQPLRVPSDAMTVEQDCEVWKHRFTALSGSQSADRWFSAYIGEDCRLLYIGNVPGRRRLPTDGQIPLSFADGYPLLLIGQASLDDLNARLKQPVAMLAFRPNLVVEGAVAFAEDRWRRVRIGGVLFDVAKPCTRCIFTTVDPERGERSADREPLLTLARYRRSEIGTCFGMNLIARSAGRLHLGDTVDVLE